MKEIKIEDLFKYINPLELEDDPAIAIASDGNETNGLTIGWAQFGVLWNKPSSTVYVHKARYSKHIFDNANYFSICFMKKEHRNIVNYFGSVSGKNENKMVNCGLKVIYDDLSPYFEDSSVTVICRVMGKSDFDINNCDKRVENWYKRDGVHTLYYGEIIKVLVSN